jgi:serine/threonine-protein kinase RsbW
MERAVLAQVELRIPRQAEFVRVARLAACALAHQLGFTLDIVEDIKLAVGEACTNAVEHALLQPSGPGSGLAPAGDDIIVRFLTHPDQLTVEVLDRGQGFDPDRAEDLAPDEDTIGGLGLMVIRQIMDEVHIECRPDTGTCVRMTKYRARKLA